MALLSPSDQAKLREAFAEMRHSVKILFFTQTLGCETCPQARQIIDELPPLSDKITVDEVNLVLDAEKAKRYGVDRVPALALLSTDNDTAAERGERPRPASSEQSRDAASGGGAPRAGDEGYPAEGVRGAGAAGLFKDSRIRFLGTPAGYEFMSLINAVLLVGGRESNLTESNRKKIAAVATPLTFQVFTTPT